MKEARFPVRMSNLLLLLAISGAVIAAFRYLVIDITTLFDGSGLGQMWGYFTEFLRPDLSPAHLKSLTRAALETLAMSAVGTLLAAGLAATLALPAAGHFGRIPAQLARWLFNLLRAIPELVWAALVVLAAGLGPNAGTLALALHTTGVLGRLFTEALENSPVAAAEAIRCNGGGRTAAFLYGTLPTLWPQWLAYTLYRWENNIRVSSVLGFVGAGGLGQMLYIHLSLFQQAQASTVILTIILLVLAVDSFSLWVRHRYLTAS